MAILFQKLSRASLRALIALSVLYGLFFMHVGQYTIFGHVNRIASTPEAHELVDSIFGSFRRIGYGFMSKLRQSLGPETDPEAEAP